MIHTASPFVLCQCGQVHRGGSDAALRGRAAWRQDYKNVYITNTLKNLMLGAILTASATNPDFGSLHTAYSTSGANEVTGGSPAYARVALTWAAASSGSTSLAATLPTWNVPASTTVSWWGGWDAVTTGNFLFMMPVGAGTLQTCSMETAADISTGDLINAKAHGFISGKPVVFWGTLPTGLAVGTIYYVSATGLTTDVFAVSATNGGAVLNITGTAPFNFFVQGCQPETFGSQGTLSLTSASIDLNAIV